MTATPSSPSSPPRRLLALESALDAISVAVFESGERVASCEGPRGRAHSSALLPVVDAALAQARLALSEIDAFALGSGPGSFTSLRIALASIKGLAFGRDVPVLGLSTLEVMAAAVIAGQGSAAPASPLVLSLLDARRGDLYAGVYRAAGYSVGEEAGSGGVAPPRAVLADGLYGPDALALELARIGATAGLLVGLCPEPIEVRARLEQAGIVFSDWIEGDRARPRAEWVGRVALARFVRGEGGSVATLSARYLRRAQAEAERTGHAAEAGVPARLGQGGR